jgi:hypothetical protein
MELLGSVFCGREKQNQTAGGARDGAGIGSLFVPAGVAAGSIVQMTVVAAAMDGATEGSWFVPLAQTTHFVLLVAASRSVPRGCEWRSGSAAKSAARKMTRIGIRRIIQPGRS